MILPNPTPTPWLWPGRFAPGVLTLLLSFPGVGATNFALDLAARVSTGRPHPDAGSSDESEDFDPSDDPGRSGDSADSADSGGGAPNPPGDVLLLSPADDPSTILRPRLDAHAADPTRVHLLSLSPPGRGCRAAAGEGDATTSPIPPSPANPATATASDRVNQLTSQPVNPSSAASQPINPSPATDQPAHPPLSTLHPPLSTLHPLLSTLHALLPSLPNPKLLIIDPLESLFPPNLPPSDARLRPLIAGLLDLARTHHFAILIIAPFARSPRTLYTTPGLRVFATAARTIFHLDEHPDDPARRLLLPLKHSHSTCPPALTFTITTVQIPGTPSSSIRNLKSAICNSPTSIPAPRILWDAPAPARSSALPLIQCAADLVPPQCAPPPPAPAGRHAQPRPQHARTHSPAHSSPILAEALSQLEPLALATRAAPAASCGSSASAASPAPRPVPSVGIFTRLSSFARGKV